MKRPSFLEGAAVALIASVAAGVLFIVLGSVLAAGPVLRFLITVLSLAYVIYLLSRGGHRVGRVTTLLLWVPTAAGLWLAGPPLWLFIGAHLGFVWLVRSLYFHSSALSALGDLGLTGLGLAAAVWAALQTHSFFASVWCFFLVQALFVLIPPRVSKKTERSAGDTAGEDRFQRAHAAAEAALRKLSSIHNHSGA
jgi:hypothetical protein